MEQDIAYVVPKKLWERLQSEWKKSKGGLELMNYAHGKNDQSGGALSGLGSSGQVDPSELMKMLAVQMNLNQSKHANFLSHADQTMKKIMDDPSLTNEERIHYLNSARDAFENQKRQATVGSALPASTASRGVGTDAAAVATPKAPRFSMPRPPSSPITSRIPTPITPRSTRTTPASQRDTSTSRKSSKRDSTTLTPASRLSEVRAKIWELETTKSKQLSKKKKKQFIETLREEERRLQEDVRELRSRNVSSKKSKT